jgi:hypothetical protein
MGKEIEHISVDTMSALSSYGWPGNIREPQNLIERAVILSNYGVLSNPLPVAATQTVAISPAATTLRDSERAVILQTLEAAGWAVGGPNGAAAKLGLKRTTLIYKMQKLAISRPGLQSSLDLTGSAPQEPASLPQSQQRSESRKRKYAAPLVLLRPELLAGMVTVHLIGGRFQPPRKIQKSKCHYRPKRMPSCPLQHAGCSPIHPKQTQLLHMSDRICCMRERMSQTSGACVGISTDTPGAFHTNHDIRRTTSF